jgi:hypothetical protein
MNLPTTPDTLTAQADEIRQAFASDHIVFQNPEYRMGDTVALLSMCAWIEATYGPKTFYVKSPVGDAPNLQRFRPQGVRVLEFWEASEAPKDAGTIADLGVAFWYWNDLLEQEGFRFELESPSPGRYPIVFHPLLEVDYHDERRMAPIFCLEVAHRLTQRYPGQVLILADGLSSHDLELWRRAKLATVLAAPLADVFELIGSARVFIGGDTGLSHVAGCFAGVRQVAIYSKEVEEDKQSEQSDLGAILEAATGRGTIYNAYPNKPRHDCRRLLMSDGGTTGNTVREVIATVREFMK